MFWPLHRCGACAFVLSHAVRCWCTQGSSILLLWCGACAFMFGHAVCCWCPQGSSVPLVSLLWCQSSDAHAGFACAGPAALVLAARLPW